MVTQQHAAWLAAQLTHEEKAQLFRIRLQTLDAATAQGRLDGPLPVRWRVGYAATLEIIGRDSDGSLKAQITVTGPELDRPYVRRVRLCKKHRLNLG